MRRPALPALFLASAFGLPSPAVDRLDEVRRADDRRQADPTANLRRFRPRGERIDSSEFANSLLSRFNSLLSRINSRFRPN
jgi:hypothetical protein